MIPLLRSEIARFPLTVVTPMLPSPQVAGKPA
jgi:hypothetical protein